MDNEFSPLQFSEDRTYYCLDGQQLWGGEALDLQLPWGWVRGRYEAWSSGAAPSIQCRAMLRVYDFVYVLSERTAVRFSSSDEDPRLPLYHLYQEAERLKARLAQRVQEVWQPVMHRPALRRWERVHELWVRARERSHRRRQRWLQPDALGTWKKTWVPLRLALDERRAREPVRHYVSAQQEIAVWRGFTILLQAQEGDRWQGWYWPTKRGVNPYTGESSRVVAVMEDPHCDLNYVRDAAYQQIEAQYQDYERRWRRWRVPAPTPSSAVLREEQGG